MAKGIKTDSLASSMRAIARDHVRGVEKNSFEDVKSAGKSAERKLRSTSPKKKGKYAKGWKATEEKQQVGSGITVVVANKKKPSLTHLLEKGHEKRGGGFVSGKKHIEPAFEEAVEELERLMQ